MASMHPKLMASIEQVAESWTSFGFTSSGVLRRINLAEWYSIYVVFRQEGWYIYHVIYEIYSHNINIV